MDAPTNPATSRVLTLATLREKGACEEQVAIFRKLFCARMEVTEARCVEHAGVFSWEWAAEKLLSAPALKAYREAIALADNAYREAVALALKACDEAIAPARKAYDEAAALADKAYREAVAPARKAYDEAAALADNAYREAAALAWARAYITDREVA